MILKILTAKFGTSCIFANQDDAQIWEVDAAILVEACTLLYRHPAAYFDSLSCLTAVENQGEALRFSIFYHLYSIPHHQKCCLLVRTEECVPSLTGVWAAANWQEREAADLLGICFENHPDPRRILLPNDWKGHPLQKKYREETHYHGIKIESDT